jgi:hypothetical protein
MDYTMSLFSESSSDFIIRMLIKKNLDYLSVTANIFIFVRCKKLTGYSYLT